MGSTIIKNELPAPKGATKVFETPYVEFVVPETGEKLTRAAREYSVSVQPSFPARSFVKRLTFTDRFPTEDKDSFKKIRRSGKIKMSTYSNKKLDIETFVMTDRQTQALLVHPHQWYHGEVNGKKYSYDWFDAGLQLLVAEVPVELTLEDLKQIPLLSVPYYEPDDVSQAVAEVKSQVVAETLQTYDLLTDLAEFKQTLSLGLSIIQSVLNPLSAMSNFAKQVNRRNATPAQRAQAITDKWMTYRYGVMPAIYSLQDVMKLLSQLDYVYRTCRAQRVIDCSATSEPSVSPSQRSLYQTVQGTVKIRATSKTRFELGNMSRLIDQTSLNIAQTAWELVPYSFVIDWFANVGDWLLANTHLATPGVSSEYCYSIKKEIIRDTYMQLYSPPIELTITTDRWGTEKSTVPSWRNRQLAQRETVTEYSRNVFHQGDVDFYVSNPYMSWKRWADTFSLTVSNLNKALRRLT